MNTETRPALITISDLWKTYYSGDVPLHALRGINLTVKNGEFLAIMGVSGSGKSTLMNILGCLDKPTKGKYLFGETDTTTQSNIELAWLRREKFGFVFQSYNLLARTTAYENVELPLLYGSKLKKKERKEIVLSALNNVGLKDKIHSLPNQLSGGQQQRVALARAIVNDPFVIFADEPTGNLDTRTSFEIMAIFQRLNEQGTTIILVTHESDIADFTKRKIVFRDGRIISDTANTHPRNAMEEFKNIPEDDDSLLTA
jgi:putative ABC transport system ATP-binding protein